MCRGGKIKIIGCNLNKKRKLYLTLLILLITIIIASTKVKAFQEIGLENDLVNFTFIIEDKLVSLVNITNKVTGVKFGVANESFWQITVRNSNTKLKVNLTYLDSSILSNSSEITGDIKKLIFMWNNTFIDRQLGQKIDRIQINVSLKNGEKLSKWAVSIFETPSPYSIFEVIMPQLIYFSLGSPVDDFLVYPQIKAAGTIIKYPENTTNDLPKNNNFYPYGAMGMQFTALYDQDSQGGLYVHAEDPLAYSKQFIFEGDNDNITIGLRHFPENSTTVNNYSLPYNFSLGVLEGDWFDASKIYRAWLIEGNVEWLNKSKLEHRIDVPQSLKDNQLIIGYIGNGTGNAIIDDNASITARSYKNFFNLTTPYIFFFEWFNDTFPGKSPKYDPKQGFREQVLKIRNELNGKVMIYTHAARWHPNASFTSTTFGFNNFTTAKNWSIINEDGSEALTPQGELIMEPFAPFWRTIVKEQIIDYLNGTYNTSISHLHHNAWGPSQLSYDSNPAHGNHSIGGGKHIYRGPRETIEFVDSSVESATGEDFTQDTEGYYENFIGTLEISANVPCVSQFSTERNIPLFSSIYHDFQLLAASDPWWGEKYSGLKSSSIFFNTFTDLVNTFAFSHGILLSRTENISNNDTTFFGDPDLNQHNIFLKQLLDSYLYSSNFIKYGEFMRPLNVTFVNVSGKQVQIITAAANCDMLSRDPIPLILSSVFKTDNGEIGIYLINWWNMSLNISYFFDFDKYGLVSSNFTILTEINNTNNSQEDIILNVSNDFSGAANLTNKSIRFFRIRPQLIASLDMVNKSSLTAVFEFEMFNPNTQDGFSWTVKPGDGNTIQSTNSLTLNQSENAFVLFEYTYGALGTYNVTASVSNSTTSNTQTIQIKI